MAADERFYFGNAVADQVRGSGWFVGQFVPAALGLRHQTDVEIKWGIHPDGEKRAHAWASEHATTVSVLVRGCLHITFDLVDGPHRIVLEQEGDYVIFAPGTVHEWEAVGETIVLSVRFPSIEAWQAAREAQAPGS